MNGYMVGNARGVAACAAAAGNTSLASNFSRIADALEDAMYRHLWNPTQEFFEDVIRPDNPNLTTVQGREEVGLFPFRFGVGLEEKYINPSYPQLFDPDGFLTTYGPTTLEVRSPYYMSPRPTSYCCYWNGQSWPFSTAHVLKWLASMYRSGNSSLTAEEYYYYLRLYAITQHKDGYPYIAESHYPDVDTWSADTTNHSEFYDHSTNNDDVLTGLLGVIPRSDNMFEIDPIIPSHWTYFAMENLPYHGHLMTVLYDADGSRYSSGAGLTIYCDGRKIYTCEGPGATVSLPNSTAVTYTSSLTAAVPVNIAANPLGLGNYTLANATSTYSLDDPYKAIDGRLFYDFIPDNRWTNNQSSNPNDTLQVTFPRPRNLSSVTLAIYSDVDRPGTGGAIACPSAIEIYGSAGLISNVSNFNCTPNDRNTIYFGREVETLYVAVNMFIRRGYGVGVCELEIWVPPNRGPTYYAVDALLGGGANVFFDTGLSATSNGAVASTNSNVSTVAFSGVYSEAGGAVELSVSYASNGTSNTAVNIAVNQISVGNITLGPTGGSYNMASITTSLWRGNNFVTVGLKLFNGCRNTTSCYTRFPTCSTVEFCNTIFSSRRY